MHSSVYTFFFVITDTWFSSRTETKDDVAMFDHFFSFDLNGNPTSYSHLLTTGIQFKVFFYREIKFKVQQYNFKNLFLRIARP